MSSPNARTRPTWRLVPLLVCAAAGSAQASTRLPDSTSQALEGRTDAARQVLELSGLGSTIETLPGRAQNQLEQVRERLGPADYPRLSAAFARAFAPESLFQRSAASLGASATEPQLRSALSWLRAPLARKMAALEEAAHDAARTAERETFFDSLRNDPPEQRRLRLIDRLDDAFDATETVVETEVALIGTIVAALQTLHGVDEQLTAEQVGHLARSMREGMTPGVRDTLRARMLFVYRNASDRELERYADHLESQEGRWIIGALNRAVLHGVEQTGVEMRAALSDESDDMLR